MIQARSADGVIHQFPDGTPDAVIDGAMQDYVKQGSPHAPGGKKPSLGQEIMGGMAAINRGLLIGDEVAAGVRTAGNVLTGKVPIQNAGADFKKSLDHWNGVEDDFTARHPVVSGNLKNTAMLATAAVPGAGEANAYVGAGRVANMARGALTAATTASAQSLLDRGSLVERGKAATAAAANPLVLGLGAAAGALAPTALKGGKAKIERPAKPMSENQQYAQTLKEYGVETTLPQRLGPAAKGLEDLGRRVPIVGQAISGANARQVKQLNRGVALKAVQSIGMGVPKSVKPGFEMVDYVDNALGAVYDKAAALVPAVKLDRQLQEEFGQIARRATDLPESEAAQFTRIINDRTQRLQSGASGATVKQIHSELGALQAEAAKKGSDTLASMLGDTRRAIMGTVERANPEAGKLVRQADEGWGIYSMMNDAAASASNRGGVFLPGQLNTQVRAGGKRLGSNMTGKGKAPLQDLATAATSLLPDTFGNPGTANTALLSGGVAGGVSAVLNPAVAPAAIATVGGLSAVATPYFLTARKVMERLPDQASKAELQQAAQRLSQLAANDPKAKVFYETVAARLARASGSVGAASQATPQNRLATSSR